MHWYPFIKKLLSVSLFLPLFLSLGQQALADQTLTSGGKPPQLIELFTSEGCSSCPPADLWISGLKNNEGLWTEYVPLAFHVDYWDWIGWKDRFASAAHTNRQRRYEQTRQVGSVYTPGFVVAGEEWRGFFSRENLPENQQPAAGELVLAIDDSQFNLSYEGDEAGTGVAHVAILGMELQTDVQRGENAGKTLEHNFVVLDWQTLPAGKTSWSGELKRDWDIETDTYAIAAWVEHSGKAQPLQVVAGYLE